MYFRKRKHQPSHVNVKPLAPAELERMLYGKPLTDTRETPPLSAGAREAKHILAAVNKEKQMPDMQTELSKVINSWEKETDMNEKRSGAPITTGVSHATYNYVKNHPGVTKAKAIEILNIQGYKPTSTTTLLAAMIRNKQIIVDLKGGMTVAKDTYEPIKTQVRAKPKPVQVRNAKPVQEVASPVEQAQGIAALTALAPTPETRGTTLTAQHILRTLNVQEAFALYKELAAMFN